MPNYGQYGNSPTWKTRFDTRQANTLRRNFEKSDGYCKVDVITPDLTSMEDVEAHIFNTSIRSIGVKQLACHPDFPLPQGSIISYIDDKKYVCMDIDSHQSIQAFGRIYLANSVLKWIDDLGVVNEAYAVDNMSLGAQDFARQVPEVDNKKKVWIQKNVNTLKLQKDFRFVFGGNEAYKISYVENWSKEGLIMFTLETTQILPEDDLINNIAYNGNPIFTPSPTNDIQFSANESQIIQGYTETITTYEVDVPATTFVFTITGLPASSYEITATTGNSITIKCKQYPYNGTLRATNSGNPLHYAEIPIILQGLF